MIIFRRGEVIKQIEPDVVLPPPQRAELATQIGEYRRRLVGLGVPIVRQYSLEEDGGYLTERTKYAGKDAYYLLQEEEGGELKIVRTMLKAMSPVLSQPEPFDVSIDAHPANWCFDENGQLHYIDFHPARMKYKGKYVVGFPEPHAEEYEIAFKRYFTRLGIMRIVRFSLARAGGLYLQDVLLRLIPQVFTSEIAQDILGGFQSLPVQKFQSLSLDERKLFVQQLTVTQSDDLREIAMVVLESLPAEIRTISLDLILELTRGDFRKPLEERKRLFEKAKRSVIGQLV